MIGPLTQWRKRRFWIPLAAATACIFLLGSGIVCTVCAKEWICYLDGKEDAGFSELGKMDIRFIPGSRLIRVMSRDVMEAELLSRLANNRIGMLRKANRGSFPPLIVPVERALDSVWLSTDWKAMLKLDAIQRLSAGDGAVIALIDTGIDLNNANLGAMLWTNGGEIPGDRIDNDGNGYVDDVHGWNMGDGNSTLQDSYGHGTAMASIIREIAPKTRIMVLKINPDGQGSFTEGALLEALLYAKHNGASIVNLSLSIASSKELQEAIRQLYDDGAVPVAAAGNGGSTSGVEFPASMSETVTVGAMYTDTQVASWISPVGPELDVMAPGVAIPVATIGGGVTLTTGTSISTAMASAVAGVIRGMNPNLGRDGIRNALFHGVRDLGAAGKDPVYGYGAIDGEKLYEAVTVTVGDTSGSSSYRVTARTPVKLCVLAANGLNETPAAEWFLMTALVRGTMLPVYLFDGKQLLVLSGATDIQQHTYPYVGNAVNVVATLSMYDLGLDVGDVLYYAYAYQNEQGDVRFPEVVAVEVSGP